MSLDPSTEAISRFIGSFHLDLEAERMRSDYEAFRAAEKLAGGLPRDPVPLPALSAPHEFVGFEPGLKYAPPKTDYVPPASPPLDPEPVPVVPIAPGLELPLREAELPAAQGSDGGGGGEDAAFLAPPPNSILTVTIQVAELSDNDLLDFGTPDVFLPVAQQMASLEALVGAAEALGAVVGSALAPHVPPALTEAEGMAARMLAAGEGPAAPGVTMTTLHGSDATGIVVEGLPAGEMPDFHDLLPGPLRPEAEVEAGGSSGTVADPATDPATDPRLDPGGSTPAPFRDMEVESGHAVESGANLAVNEALVTLRWVDAPVIAVGGSVVELAAISQTNVMVSSTLPGGTPSGLPGGTPSGLPGGTPSGTAINAAAIEQVAAPGPGPGETAAETSQPLGWRIATIEGDLTAMNWVQQYVFLSDMDRAEVVFTGDATWIGLGGNLASNHTSLVELGYHYDLVVVDGDMLTLTSISQTNVLLDTDVVTGAPAGSVTAQDNLQLNSARITKVGLDRMEAMSEGIQGTVESMVAGGGPAAAILADPLFAGFETLNVLHVKGDLIKLNVIEQVNVLGDADQLHMALGTLAALEGAQVSIVTGSNAQLNLAHVLDDGIDSTVMAAGGGYSDALIHQAGLVDLEAPPGGVMLAPVVSEAIAFLVDGMIDPIPDLEIAPVPGLPDMPGGLDVMQTALA
ncbi:hypothetical protein ORIO_20350 (plasmid) [Cereibacter azotoformans]|uniref:hypothetical protein n=1 Tax=Cereibacter azotoformans TaxID=43057 RepID=UPI001EEAF67F|nr:hypothetical protein [Cereibacter azotoformans]ULB12157.1 hypothetical protein ORIO_20350 [Cereibacter azotoformans]